MRPLYDEIGRGYALERRPDPRIASRIAGALGGTRSVLDVGSGTGSYEPRGFRVVAVEPSVEMIRQRPDGAAPVVRAVAEALPFPDDAFDGEVHIETVTVPHDCTDGFLGAYWRRPDAYLDPNARAAMSAFPPLGDDVVAAGVERLRADLDSGAWHERHGHLLELREIDLGYRLVVAAT